MNLQTLIETLYPSGSPIQPTAEQRAILAHKEGPAWVLAGPGSGKTEVLALLVLRLLFVSDDASQKDRVPPESIFVTTFTEKAARNLQERVSRFREVVVAKDPSLAAIDLSKIRIGTLHGLANDLLQEARSPNYRNVRLMDELETAMFVHENMSIIRNRNFDDDHGFWSELEFMFSPQAWKSTFRRLPLEWDMARTLITVFNRICEDRKDLTAMKAAGGAMAQLADLYQEYQGHLATEHRCDFSQLQQRFLDFLEGPLGTRLRDGVVGDPDLPGITHVLVDEYQDTNLIQEAIYFTLAHRDPFNLVVVGDDDQAMYRFRGGSVECMVTFDEACHQFLGVPETAVCKYPLVGNFRSHPDIVKFSNKYLTSFSSMQLKGARVPGKPLLVPKSTISGAYPAVGILRAPRIANLGQAFGDAVHDLKSTGRIADYSQVCLLLTSTRESPRNAQPYADALRARGIPVYNPRSRTFLAQPEVAGLLGCLLLLLDPDAAHQPTWSPDELPAILADFRNQAIAERTSHKALATYIDSVRSNLAKHPDQFLDATLQELVYYLLSLPPFEQAMADPVSRSRLANLTKLIESYASIPVQGKVNVFRGNLRANADGSGSVHPPWLKTFYSRFFGYLAKGGVNDLEDATEIAPLGMVSIMTMHQAKGLEFPFVFVGHLSEGAAPSGTHHLEDKFSGIPNLSGRVFPVLAAAVRSELDTIRQFFVAYSRAEYALVLLGTTSQLNGGAVPCGPKRSWLRENVLEL